MTEVAITGAAGFLGNALNTELGARGYRTIKIDTELPLISRAPTVWRGDVREPGLLTHACRNSKHLVAAACVVVGAGGKAHRQWSMYRENDAIVKATLDAAIYLRQNCKLEKLTYISSSMVYEQAKVVPTPEYHCREAQPLHNPYAIQKMAAEHQVRMVAAEYGLPFTIIRPGNLVGPGPPADPDAAPGTAHLVPDLVLRIGRGDDPLRVLGSGDQVRSYTSVRDVARGIALSLDHPMAAGSAFNIASPAGFSVREVAYMIAALHQRRLVIEETDRPAYDMAMNVPSTVKAQRVLGFQARETLQDVLQEVVAATAP